MKTKDIYRFKGFRIVALSATSLISATGFFWPFLSSENRSTFFFWLATPLALVLLLAIIGQANLDAKSLALLAVLSAIIAALRPLGAGAAGIEPMWFLLILSSYIFGSSFGFLLGAQSMLLSAFLTGGFGPWLPYQVFAAGWIGLLAGAIPKTKRFQIPVIAIASLINCLICVITGLVASPNKAVIKASLACCIACAISDDFDAKKKATSDLGSQI